jgi:ABC-type polysaccharide/polyol phosphate export permease
VKTGAVPGRETSFMNSLAIQLRVIRALLMREVITRFGRHNVGVLWLLGEPMLFTLGVAALWSAAGMNHGSGLPIIAFAITGYSSVLMWRNSVSRVNSSIQQNFNLLYHRNVRVLDVFLTRVILELAGATGSFIVLALFFTIGEWIKPPEDLLKVLQGWAMLAWFGTALSLTIGAATAYSEIIERLWHPTSYLLFPLSGAAFMVEWLPPAVVTSCLLLPMVHGVEMVREGYFRQHRQSHYDLGYMAMCCLALTLVGLFLFATLVAVRRSIDFHRERHQDLWHALRAANGSRSRQPDAQARPQHRHPRPQRCRQVDADPPPERRRAADVGSDPP